MRDKKVELFLRRSLMLMLNVIRILPIISTVVFCAFINAAQEKHLALTLTVDPYPPRAITALSAKSGNNLGEILLNWIAPGDDGMLGQLKAGAYQIQYDISSPSELGGDATSWWEKARDLYATDLSWIPNYPGMVDTKTIGDLTPKVTYYFAVKAKDKVGNWSSVSNVVSARARWDLWAPDAVADLSARLSGDGTHIVLEWTAPSDYGNYDPIYDLWNEKVEWPQKAHHYQIKKATVSVGEFSGDAAAWWSAASEISPPEPAEPRTKQSIELKDLMVGVTYYFALKSFDEQGLESECSVEAVIMPHDFVAPREPAGIRGTLSADGKTMTIMWSSVTCNANGRTIEDLAGYNIYKARELDGVYVLKDFIPSGQALRWRDPDNVKGKVFYYMVRAKDSSHNTSGMSMIVVSDKNVSVIAADETDMKSYIAVSNKVSSILYAATNSYGDDIRIEVLRSTGDENGRILKSYTFAAEKGRTHIPVTNISFEKAEAEIVLSYKVEGGFVKTAAIPENEARGRLAIFAFNGNEWIKLGGDVNESAHTVRIKTKRLGKFILKNSLRALRFTIMAVMPDKIFTPNGDGWNDYFEITYENPADGMVSGKIYDLKGRFVKGMEKGGSAGDTVGSLKWDGRDISGGTAPSGVYFYQIEITGPENKVINGTCVIAK